jgi:Tfp pilus assembly PilM family ATPase
VSPGVITADDIVEPEYVAALVEDAVRELKTNERRCVAAVGLPAARLRTVALPAMTALERNRTARFEAARYVGYPVAEAIVRIRRLSEDSRLWALGIVRAETLRARVACLKKAGLRVRSMEDEGCALRRCLSDYDAVLDIGQFRSTIYPVKSLEAFQVQTAGAEITAAIERDLNIDRSAAEKRKRILGTAGAGERAKADLVISLASIVQEARNVTDCQSVALVGNGARLPGLQRDLVAATGSRCELAVSHALDGESYATDVLWLGAADWTLAAALSQ